jgi:flagellar protein FlaI
VGTRAGAGPGASKLSVPWFDGLRGQPYAAGPMADPSTETTFVRGRWAVRHVPPAPRSIVELIRDGTLDTDLAATLWVLLEGRVPLLVAAADPGVGKSTLLAALLDLVPPDVRRIELAGATETFDWLPQASELGWRRPAGQAALPGHTSLAGHASGDREPEPAVRPDSTLIVIPELSDHLPSYTWGAEARIAIRAATIGYGLAATIHADSLEEVLAGLRRPPVSADDDELTRLGLVLILRRVGDRQRRVVAAHYIRPTARDEHGHVQRLGPAVLSTWDQRQDRFEHFGWGITPELAVRIGWHPGDLEVEVDRRRDFLADLSTAGVVGVDDVRTAIAGYRSPMSPIRPTTTN